MKEVVVAQPRVFRRGGFILLLLVVALPLAICAWQRPSQDVGGTFTASATTRIEVSNHSNTGATGVTSLSVTSSQAKFFAPLSVYVFDLFGGGAVPSGNLEGSFLRITSEENLLTRFFSYPPEEGDYAQSLYSSPYGVVLLGDVLAVNTMAIDKPSRAALELSNGERRDVVVNTEEGDPFQSVAPNKFGLFAVLEAPTPEKTVDGEPTPLPPQSERTCSDETSFTVWDYTTSQAVFPADATANWSSSAQRIWLYGFSGELRYGSRSLEVAPYDVIDIEFREHGDMTLNSQSLALVGEAKSIKTRSVANGCRTGHELLDKNWERAVRSVSTEWATLLVGLILGVAADRWLIGGLRSIRDLWK